MDKMIEVRYAGAVVGRSAVVRDVDPQGLFVGVTEPMPVGTELVLKIGDEAVPGKVIAVSESQEQARAGMRVQFVDADEAILFGMALTASMAAPSPVGGAASAPTAVGLSGSGGVAAGSASVASGRVAAAVGLSASGGAAAGSAHVAAARVPATPPPIPSGAVAPPAPREATGALPVAAADDEGELEVEPRSAPHVSPAAGDRPPAPREPEISGPVSSGTGAGGGQAGGGRKNRRNRRR